MASRKVLVTGGQRSGKSRYAESLVAGSPSGTYIAPGYRPDPAFDPEWASRVASHRSRRPDSWTTIETRAVGDALRTATPPVLIDCLGTWVTAVVDEFGTWDIPLVRWQDRFRAELDDLVTAWEGADGLLVAVTNEVGMGLVSEHRSGRVFTDLLGRVNQAIAAVSDDVILVVAGRTLRL
jgi:adenosylcobinamide kinase/adenosylcobinamide-phosphate guanylyltransferase